MTEEIRIRKLALITVFRQFAEGSIACLWLHIYGLQ